MLKVERDKRKGRRGWRIRGTVHVWRNGKRVSTAIDKSLAGGSKAQAESIKAQIEGEATLRTHENRDREPTFAEAALNYVEQGGEARFLEKPIAWLGDFKVSQVTNERIARECSNAYPHASDSTKRRQWWTPVRAVLNHHERGGPRAPVSAGRRTHFVQPSEAERIIQYFSRSRWGDDHYGAALVTTLFGCGPRLGEALLVDARNDLKLDLGQITFRHTKNDQERTVRLPSRVRAAISLIPTRNEPGPLFRRFDGKPFKERVARGGQIRGRFQKAVEEAGLDPSVITPHVCRHSWATWFYAVTKDPLLLQQNGGWLSNEWQRYTKLATEELAREVTDHGWNFVGSFGGTDHFVGVNNMVKSQ